MIDPRIALFLHSGGGLLALAALLAWLWNAGRVRASRLFGASDREVRTLAVVTWTCAVLTLAAMLLGAVGMLHPFIWAGLAACGGLVLCRRGAASWGDTRNTTAESEPWDAGPSRLFTVGVAMIVMGRFVFGLRNPPSDVDSILYHMPMAAHWMATAGLGVAQLEPTLIANFYPGNVEILSLGFAWLTGRETLMTVPGVLSLGLLAYALRRLALEAGARRAIAEVAAFALVCAPGVLQLSLGLRVDNVMAAWFAVALVFALRARRTGAHGDVEVALCAIGLLGGCKASGPPLAAVALAAMLAGAGLRTRLATALKCRFGLVTLLLAGGFWLVRNAIAMGNPVYPAAISLGSWTLPGLAGHSDLFLTSQLAMWRAGLPGHLSLPNLWRYFGPSLLLLVPGAIAGAAVLVARRRSAGRLASIALLSTVALTTAGLTIVQPFSGANDAASPGAHLRFSADNVRCLMPTLVALVPIAAVGLSSLPVLPVVVLGLVLGLLGLAPRAGHMLPALVLVVLGGLLWRMRPRAPARSRAWGVGVAVAACALVAAAVTAVEPMRERQADRVWDSIIDRFDSVPAAVAREVRAQSGGRPIAVAGTVSLWALYGRELSGRPEYVPVGTPLANARTVWRFAPDQRERATAELWRRNLRLVGAPFVVLVTGDRLRPVEREWCEADPAHFTPVYVTEQRAVYRVVGM